MISRFLILFIITLFPASPAFAETLTDTTPSVKPEVALYLEGKELESQGILKEAANKYQEALFINPTFALANHKLAGISKNVLTDHRKILEIDPGYSIKPSFKDPKAIAGPIWLKDIMPGYLMVYEHPQLGKYAVFSLKSRHMHNVHYLFVQEDKTWTMYPSASLPGVTRYQDTLVYHQTGETIAEDFMKLLVEAYYQALKP